MQTISLKLSNAEALDLDHILTSRIYMMDVQIGKARRENRTDDALSMARECGRLDKVQENLRALGRQHFIGW